MLQNLYLNQKLLNWAIQLYSNVTESMVIDTLNCVSWKLLCCIVGLTVVFGMFLGMLNVQIVFYPQMFKNPVNFTKIIL